MEATTTVPQTATEGPRRAGECTTSACRSTTTCRRSTSTRTSSSRRCSRSSATRRSRQPGGRLRHARLVPDPHGHPRRRAAPLPRGRPVPSTRSRADRWLGEGPVMGIPKEALGEITAADLEATGMEVRAGATSSPSTRAGTTATSVPASIAKARSSTWSGGPACARSPRTWLVDARHRDRDDRRARDRQRRPHAVRRRHAREPQDPVRAEHPGRRGPGRRARRGDRPALPDLVRARSLQAAATRSRCAPSRSRSTDGRPQHRRPPAAVGARGHDRGLVDVRRA